MSDEYVGERGLNTLQMLEDKFMEQLGRKPDEAAPSPEDLAVPEDTKEAPEAPVRTNVDREKLLNELDDIRNKLIDTFACGDDVSRVGEIVANQINRLSKCAAFLGAKAEHFDPLDHVSGLHVPDVINNAERVVSNTKTYYKLGKVVDEEISNDEIRIAFTGKKGGITYEASGTIRGQSWQGNEAIDYIYTPGSGKMSVKAFENGKWTDKSDQFDISWELTEEEAKEENSNNEGDDFDIIEK